MATMATNSPAGPDVPVVSNQRQTTAVPSRNPLPLSASQEAQVREVYYKRVRALCAPEIKAFADCAVGRTFSIPFACRAQHRAMNNCMKMQATEENHDLAREEWFAGRMERQKEKEAKARRKLEQERFHREWWGLPDRDAEELRAEEEKLKRAERVGGMAARDRARIPVKKDEDR
ncbi:hypothetical protein PpBr36_00824 [Pyricularia pennisetigena]|uniref:hypothetical protein n=1 Tax=Pyricularia pennisetigena TaxID=1578925 RepID=UPI001151316D|nr:hypothetical protein PpBr36_00824 [Pyricularia pennisetigena]TLS28652.1 hypothetical protein PpBr36_00824 [Pyricularia pennisetigena]